MVGGRNATDWIPQWGAAALALLMTIDFYGSVHLGWPHRVPILLILSVLAIGLAVFSFVRGVRRERRIRRQRAVGRLNRFQDEVSKHSGTG